MDSPAHLDPTLESFFKNLAQSTSLENKIDGELSVLLKIQAFVKEKISLKL